MTDRADGIVDPSATRPRRRFHYSPPHGSPPTPTRLAGSPSASALIEAGLEGVERIRTPTSADDRRYDFRDAYVRDLPSIIDLDAIRNRVRRGSDGRRSVSTGADRNARHRPDRRTRVDRSSASRPRLGREDPHGSLVAERDGIPRAKRATYDVLTGNDADTDRHGIVTPMPADESEPLPRSRDRLSFARRVAARRRDRQDARVVDDHRPRRRVAGPSSAQCPSVQVVRAGSARRLGPGGEESAGASFTHGRQVWSTDKDGICLPARRRDHRRHRQDPVGSYRELEEAFGSSAYQRVDARRRQAKATLGKLTRSVAWTDLAGETSPRSCRAPGNGADQRAEGADRARLVAARLRHGTSTSCTPRASRVPSTSRRCRKARAVVSAALGG